MEKGVLNGIRLLAPNQAPGRDVIPSKAWWHVEYLLEDT